VLGFDEKSAKALYRRGVAYIHLRDLDRAEADLTKAAVLDPADPAIKSELKKVKHLQALEDQKQKKLYSGFLNKVFASNTHAVLSQFA
jgi:peptidyl-prolyl isomerase D